MTSEKSELPEVTEQLQMLADRREKLLRRFLAILVVVSGIVLVVGILYLGESLANVIYSGTNQNITALKASLFMTFFGTVVLILCGNRLMAKK